MSVVRLVLVCVFDTYRWCGSIFVSINLIDCVCVCLLLYTIMMSNKNESHFICCRIFHVSQIICCIFTFVVGGLSPVSQFEWNKSSQIELQKSYWFAKCDKNSYWTLTTDSSVSMSQFLFHHADCSFSSHYIQFLFKVYLKFVNLLKYCLICTTNGKISFS